MISNFVVDNLVISAQLSDHVKLSNIHASNHTLCYEPELFPAILISCWLPVHVTLFYNSKVVITGLKSEKQADIVLDRLINYVHTQNIVK